MSREENPGNRLRIASWEYVQANRKQLHPREEIMGRGKG